MFYTGIRYPTWWLLSREMKIVVHVELQAVPLHAMLLLAAAVRWFATG